MENFFGIMKQEMYYGKVYYSFEELKQAVTDYIFYYNNIGFSTFWMYSFELSFNSSAVNTLSCFFCSTLALAYESGFVNPYPTTVPPTRIDVAKSVTFNLFIVSPFLFIEIYFGSIYTGFITSINKHDSEKSRIRVI